MIHKKMLVWQEDKSKAVIRIVIDIKNDGCIAVCGSDEKLYNNNLTYKTFIWKNYNDN